MSETTSELPKWDSHSAAPHTHNRIHELVQQYFSDIAGKKVCDLPCGAGLFSARLAQLGAQVTPVDLETVEPFRYDRSRLVLADANQSLPFQDNEFDAMVSIEGIEHLENPSFFVRECARIVKANGLIILSTPNVDSYRSRRSIYAHGYPRYFRPDNCEQKMAWHLHPLDMVFMRGALRKAGLEIVEIAVNSMHGKNFFSELLRPLFNRKLPPEMRGPIPFYGEVAIYVLRVRKS